MDIGGIIKAPFEDQEWLKKLLLMGVVTFLICITVIGIFVAVPNLIGWGVTVARNRMNGNNTLPDFGFGYIGLGYRAIVAALSLIVLGLAGGIVIGIITVVLSKIHLQAVGMILNLLFALVMIPFAIAVNYRFVVHDDILAGIRFGWLFSFVLANIGKILMVVVVGIILGFIGFLMGLVPIVGGMFGMAFGAAAQGALYAELARATNRA